MGSCHIAHETDWHHERAGGHYTQVRQGEGGRGALSLTESAPFMEVGDIPPILQMCELRPLVLDYEARLRSPQLCALVPLAPVWCSFPSQGHGPDAPTPSDPSGSLPAASSQGCLLLEAFPDHLPKVTSLSVPGPLPVCHAALRTV